MKQNVFEAVLLIFMLALSLVIGFCFGTIWTQNRAAEAGVGQYSVNATNGITQFQFRK